MNFSVLDKINFDDLQKGNSVMKFNGFREKGLCDEI